MLFFAFQGVIDYVKKEKFRAEGAVQSRVVRTAKKPRGSPNKRIPAYIIGENPSTKLVGAEEEPLRKAEHFL